MNFATETQRTLRNKNLKKLLTVKYSFEKRKMFIHNFQKTKALCTPCLCDYEFFRLMINWKSNVKPKPI